MTKNTKVHIVYCHPENSSMTNEIKKAYIQGLKSKNIEYTITDLYKEHFQSDLTRKEYQRESEYISCELSRDVRKQQKLINDADILTFIFPLFWMDAPSKLVGYFSRVFTVGFRYTNDNTKSRMKTLKEVNFLIITGSSYEDLLNDGKIEALKTIFIKDRIADKSQRTRMYFFSNTAVHKKERLSNKEKYIQRARKIGFITPRTI
jgi:NAD(P)H dehydrogenase (quinone)